MPTETQILNELAKGYELPPLRIRRAKPTRRMIDSGINVLLEATMDGQTSDFVAEIKTRNNPREFETALFQLEQLARQAETPPMLVVPYLRESQLDELLKRKLSGIDLSGNGVVVVPDKLVVYRTGRPNLFPDSLPTKYAYRGATSLVARAFLCCPTFQSLADIEQEITRRGGKVVLSTISKALKRLESDIIVDRTAASLRLRQPDKLLEALVASYTEPKITNVVTLATKSPLADLLQTAADGSVALSGRSSLTAYAVMGRDERPVIYTRNAEQLLRTWGGTVTRTSRFIDFELRQTDDPTVYFDVRRQQNLPYASPIQVVLECSTGDKREQETANQVRELILSELQG